MLDFLKAAARPSSIASVLLLLLPGVIMLYTRDLGRWGRRWLTAVLLGYWIFSAPASVLLLSRTLTRGYEPISSADQIRGAEAIVVLSGGMYDERASGRDLPIVVRETALRVLEAARLYHLAGSPLVIASGGVTDRHGASVPESVALRQALIQLAVPSDRIVSESASKNTRDEALLVREMLRARGLSRIVLVTSPLHMRRSMATFVAQGMHPIPAVSAIASEGTLPAWTLWPTDPGLSLGDGIVYEWAASAYYWWRGWI